MSNSVSQVNWLKTLRCACLLSLSTVGAVAPVEANVLNTTVLSATSLSDLFGKPKAQMDDKPLPVHQAFQVVPIVQATAQGSRLVVNFNVTDGYYVYQDKLKLTLPTGVSASAWQFSQQPTFVNDPDFGRVPVFEQDVVATATLTTNDQYQGAINTGLDASLKWQGCAKAGLCYPPEKVAIALTGLSAPKSELKSASTTSPVSASVTSPTALSSASSNTAVASTLAQTATQTSQVPVVQTQLSDDSAPNTTLTNDSFGLAEHTGLALFLLFLAGLGLAFTPCVLPMLPIVANIVARQHKPTAKKGLMLTGAYGLGVATSYGILGAIVAVFGQSLGLMNMLQNPAVLWSFAGLFVLLGLYMLDWLPIRLPLALSTRLHGLSRAHDKRLGSVRGSFLTGLLSSLVVSPCVSAPLAGAVAGVATLGNPVIGFFALFLLGLGLSTPLIILGATQGNFMPTAGAWMNAIKQGFALLLFSVALLMIERVFHSPLMLVLWAIWFAVVAVWAWRFGITQDNKTHKKAQGTMLTKALALLCGGWMLCLLGGVATGSTDSWRPLEHFTSAQNQTDTGQNNKVTSRAITIHRMSELAPLLAQHPNVLVDVTADWCIECRIMDKNLFKNPPTALGDWQVVRLDVTEDNADSKAVYANLQVFGPPVLLYYQNARLVARQNGEVKRDEFEQQLAKLTTQP